MKENLTELVFILDKSGSMSGLEDDTIGGFNSLVAKQKNEKGDAILSTILFSDYRQVLHNRVNIKGVNKMTREEYFTSGCTALLDAVGISIKHIIKVHNALPESEKPSKTLFVITTDGMENASREYSYHQIKKLIEQQREKGWEFLFLGANIDAQKEAIKVGIAKEKAVRFRNDSKGIKANYEALSEAVSCMRANDEINDDWAKIIEDDYKERKDK